MLLFYYGQIAQGNKDPGLIKDYIAVESLIAQVDPQISLGIVQRESRFNCDAVGDKGKSFGCWQIHLPTHQSFTPDKARDVVLSTQWSLKEIKENGCKIWSTCEATMKSLSVTDS